LKNLVSTKELGLLALMLIVFASLPFLFPQQANPVYTTSLDYLKEMALIVPPVFILMGLFEVWIPKDFIKKFMSKEAGTRGILLAMLFGTIPTGPLYIAFPLAAFMYSKGARIMNVVIFLQIWAAAKLPQLMVEVKFLGATFTATRFVLTVTSAVIVGFLVEYLMQRGMSREEKDYTTSSS